MFPHRPEVCYPGLGWTLMSDRAVTVAGVAGGPLEAHLFHFSRSGLGGERITVLNFYVVDGETCPDVSLLRSRAWRGSGGVRYAAQAQITAETEAAAGADAEGMVLEFAAQSCDAIREEVARAATRVVVGSATGGESQRLAEAGQAGGR